VVDQNVVSNNGGYDNNSRRGIVTSILKGDKQKVVDQIVVSNKGDMSITQEEV
jgi:hypothetical protein